MKTAKERGIPTNSDCPLTDAEMSVLLQYLDKLEWKEYQRVKQQTSGWCYVTVEEYDEFEVAIFVEWGVDGQWRDDDAISITREFLSKPEKLLS